MIKKTVAVFIDWDNIRKGVFEAATPIYGAINYNNIDNVLTFINAFLDVTVEETYRIFVYLCEPYSGHIGGINYKTTPVYANGMNFIERLQIRELVAVRRGKIVFRGMTSGNKPLFEQKQVDMLLGLDVAHVAYNHLADRVLILTCDTDLIPAMKVARINGLQVAWGCCPDIQASASKDIKKHSDFIREIPFSDIFSLAPIATP